MITPNSAQREQLRLSLLRFLDATPQHSTSLVLLYQFVRAEGRAWLTVEATGAELLYLADKGLVRKAEKVLSPENTEWVITAAGRDLYAQFQC